MAISIDWPSRVIFVPKSDLNWLGGTDYELDLDWFRLQLKDLEDSEEGMAFPDTHTHNTEVLLGGVTYARIIEIINGYTITFEDGLYTVDLIGANSNVSDVVNLNQVSIRSHNSAGLVNVDIEGAMASVLTSMGFTSVRADNLDHLDADVSSRSSHTAADAADAVLDEPLTPHISTPGSLGEAISHIGGLLHLNAVIDDFVYDGNGSLLGCVVRVYDSKAHAITNDGVTGLIHTFTMDAAYVSSKTDLYRMVKE